MTTSGVVIGNVSFTTNFLGLSSSSVFLVGMSIGSPTKYSCSILIVSVLNEVIKFGAVISYRILVITFHIQYHNSLKYFEVEVSRISRVDQGHN